MKKYDFDNIVDRRNTDCGKWDTLDIEYPDCIHLGVADMDFVSSDQIRNQMNKIIEHGIFGYTDTSDKFYEAIISWYKRKHNLEIKKEWILFCPRINIALGLTLNALLDKNQKVTVNTPMYSPLVKAIKLNGYSIIEEPLILKNNKMCINYEELHKKIETEKMFLLCNPHNPTLRAFQRDELLEIVKCVKEKDLYIFSDEIHMDIMMNNNKFCSILEFPEIYDKLIVAGSAAKTFNVPGLVTAYLIIPNKEIRNKIANEIDRVGMHNPNVFANNVFYEAYMNSDEWYEQVIEYINENEKFVRRFFKEKLPKLNILDKEATYMLWIDYSKLKLSEDEFNNILKNEAKVEVYMGSNFGKQGVGYFRMNIATSRKILEEALNNMFINLKDI